MKFVKAHKKLVIAAGIVVVVVVVFFGLQNAAKKAIEGAFSAPDTTTLSRTKLEQIVTATGIVQYGDKQDVFTTFNSKVLEINAQVGDVVEEGDILCQLDTTDLDKTIADTQNSIADAQAVKNAQLAQAKRKLSDSQEQKEIDKDNQYTLVTRAKRAWDDAKDDAEDSADDAATASCAAAASNITVLKDAMTTAKSEMDTAKADLDTAKAAEEEETVISGLQTTYDDAAENYSTAKSEYDDARSDYRKAWDSAYDSAYDAASIGITNAKNAYNNARTTRETVLRNDDIMIQNSKDNITNLELNDSTQSMRTQLSNYLIDKEDAAVKAPMSGTVTASNAAVGTSAVGGSLFTIEDVSSLEVVAVVPEYDMVQLTAGLPVNLTTNATGDENLAGTVSKVSPVAVDADGNFQVTIELTKPDERVKSGMSAKLRIITESKKNVFTVPYDAVITSESGETIVVAYDETVPPEDSRTEISVTMGMETDYYVEIIGTDLKEGLVILNDPEGKTVEAGLGGANPMFIGGNR
ncbi:MAG: efflux RND transporter periplasmic adaptor subunit [Acetanaerobacterium sp.]